MSQASSRHHVDATPRALAHLLVLVQQVQLHAEPGAVGERGPVAHVHHHRVRRRGRLARQPREAVVHAQRQALQRRRDACSSAQRVV